MYHALRSDRKIPPAAEGLACNGLRGRLDGKGIMSDNRVHRVKSTHKRLKRPWLARFASVLVLGALLAGIRLAPAEAGGEIVSPRDGLTVALGSTNVSIFYQPTAKGFQVVATAGAEKSSDVIRWISTLMPDQEVAISVPRAVGQSAIELRLHRNGDVLELVRPVS